MDGVVATNTTLARDAVKGLRHAEKAGDIMSALDAVSKIAAGADVVQIDAGLINKRPALVKDASNALKRMENSF